MLNGGKRLYTQYISGANKYQFEFDDINSSYLRTIASTGTSLLLQPQATLPLQYGKTYNVRVRASFDKGQLLPLGGSSAPSHCRGTASCESYDGRTNGAIGRYRAPALAQSQPR
ncbi:MAG: hypothetical protein IPK99_11070 [Flavobacteriales bacterium]|nr:hypothetical protein [Flavobacteriales bacterium]